MLKLDHYGLPRGSEAAREEEAHHGGKADNSLTFLIVIAVVLGMLAGRFVLPAAVTAHCGTVINFGLYLLLFMVGMDMGKQGTLLADIKTAGFQVLLVPVAVCAGSLAFAALAGLFLPLGVKDSMAAASGLGWYSLAPLLLFMVGMDMGKQGTLLADIKTAGFQVLLVPVAVCAGSLAFAALAGLVLPLGVKDSMAAASGLGWYSLAPTLLAPYSLSVSAVAFLSNVMREIFAIITIPIVAKYVGYVECASLPGAAAMDTVLPVVVGATHERITIYSFTSGVVLSLAVPLAMWSAPPCPVRRPWIRCSPWWWAPPTSALPFTPLPPAWCCPWRFPCWCPPSWPCPSEEVFCMEIERRWLVEGWPALAPSSVLQMDQGYFAVRPAIRIRREAVLGGETRYVLCFKGGAGLAREEVEVDVDEGRYLRLRAMPAIRIRREAVLGGETRYVLCFKGGAGLAREEVEVDVDEGRYLRLRAMLSGPMIEKEQRRYPLPGGLTLEVNQVDPALESGFYYAEVEFDAEAAALAWTPPEALTAYLSHEVTGQPGESMAAYWARTRG